MNKKLDLLQDNVRKTFMRYLVPSVSATVMISVNYFVDTLCIGRELGEAGLASLNLAWPITTVLYSVGLMFGVGGGAVFSRYIAKNKIKEARSVYTAALISMLFFTALITILGLVFLEPLVTMLGAYPEIRQGTTEYVKVVLILAIGYIGECFYTSFLRNDNSPKLAMAGTLLACTSNIIFDILFVVIFKWGLKGAALATSLAVTLTVVMGAAASLRKKSNLKICFTYINLKQILNIVKVGMPTFLTEIDPGIVTFVYNTVLIRIAGNNSTSVIAIYGIVVNVNTIVLATINGISNTMQPLVSANSGAGKLLRVKKITALAVKWAIAISIIYVIGIEWKAELLVKIFLEPGGSFLIQASHAIRIVAVSYILAAANMIIISYFQCVQAAKEAIYLSFLRTLIFPVMFVISGAFYLNIEGVWLASILVEGVTLITLLYVYRNFQFKRKRANLGKLNFYEFDKEVDSMEEIIGQIGADNLNRYQQVMEYCGQRDTANEGIPMMIGLDDLTVNRKEQFEASQVDEELSFQLALGVLLFADLYGQQDEAAPIIPAISALAERFFNMEQDENFEFTQSLPYTKAIYGTKKWEEIEQYESEF